MFQFFQILIFSQDIKNVQGHKERWGNFHYVPEMNLISSNSDKSLLSPVQNKLKEI